MRAVHWREAAIDGGLLGLFMLSAALFGTMLFAAAPPAWLAVAAIASLPEPARAALMGLAMGATAAALVYSPPGQRSGAHMNPAVTLAFLRLGKVERADALAYLIAQPLGGVAGVLLATALLGSPFTDPPVRSVATLPGAWGQGVAFFAEAAMAFVLFTVVLRVSNHPRLRRYTGVAVAGLVALFIAIEAPVSGMSLNPARSFASALPSGLWTGFWIYLSAPLVGVLGAAELHARSRGFAAVVCAKLHHTDRHDCIFRCGWCRHSAAPPGIQGPG